ncbi:MAG: hypothetical protein WAO91_00390 [Candidatus Nitrosotenuis sp.]
MASVSFDEKLAEFKIRLKNLENSKEDYDKNLSQILTDIDNFSDFIQEEEDKNKKPNPLFQSQIFYCNKNHKHDLEMAFDHGVEGTPIFHVCMKCFVKDTTFRCGILSLRCM